MLRWEEKQDSWGTTVLLAYHGKSRVATADWYPSRTCRLRAIWVSKKDYYGQDFTKEELREQIQREWDTWLERTNLSAIGS